MAFYNRGIVFEDQGEDQKAVLSYSAAISLKPSMDGAFYNRGLVLLRLRENDKAVQDFNETIRLNPRHQNAWFSRGFVCLNKGEYDQAIQDLTRVLTIVGTRGELSDDALYNRAYARLKKKEHDMALEDLVAILEHTPTQTEQFFNQRGNCFLGKRELDKAIADYNEALRVNPRYSYALYNRSVTRFLQQQQQPQPSAQQLNLVLADHLAAVALESKWADVASAPDLALDGSLVEAYYHTVAELRKMQTSEDAKAQKPARPPTSSTSTSGSTAFDDTSGPPDTELNERKEK